MRVKRPGVVEGRVYMSRREWQILLGHLDRVQMDATQLRDIKIAVQEAWNEAEASRTLRVREQHRLAQQRRGAQTERELAGGREF